MVLLWKVVVRDSRNAHTSCILGFLQLDVYQLQLLSLTVMSIHNRNSRNFRQLEPGGNKVYLTDVS
jgi:hypothetical protein